MKKVAIVQSNYIPWKGYFDLINSVDEFILFDDAQYTKRDWRNRNLIKTPNGLRWLTIPVKVKDRYFQKIKETEVFDCRWNLNHWNNLKANYSKAPYFSEIYPLIKNMYLENRSEFLSQINRHFIEKICEYLNINTKISCSSNYKIISNKSECLAGLCVQANASQYISGPNAKSYLDEGIFIKNNIDVVWFNYDCYPEYNQLWGEFFHNVSIIDLLFCCGQDSIKYLKKAKS